MAKDSQIQFRVSSQKKAAWKDAASAEGQSLSFWLERLADEQVALNNAEEGVKEGKRAERRLLMKKASPQGHGFKIPEVNLQGGKKTYEPDFR